MFLKICILVRYSYGYLLLSKQKFIETLISKGNNIYKKANSLNKTATHNITDCELTDQTKEMRELKQRQLNNTIESVNSKWIYLQLKEINALTGTKSNNSMTRARW